VEGCGTSTSISAPDGRGTFLTVLAWVGGAGDRLEEGERSRLAEVDPLDRRGGMKAEIAVRGR